MELATKICWLIIAAIHASPAAVLFRPALTNTLYGVAPDGAAGLLLVHRGGLFLAVFAVAVFAAFVPDARKAATIVAGISVLSFLAIYLLAGAPAGPLRTIALADLVALPPLAVVIWRAWLSA
jgi:hypothetical protein